MKIGIIGGGAAGMIAAISAARNQAQVMILEGGDRIGKKILATGNGKCNFTNEKMEQACFRSNSIETVSSFLNRFGHKETLEFFESLGMMYKSKHGYYYPYSEQASTVLDALRYEIERQKEYIKVLTEKKARSLTYLPDGSVKVLCGTESFIFDRVILACGSKASPKTGSDGSGYQLIRSLRCGCDMIEPVPALVQLRCKETYLKAVAGVRIEGSVSLYEYDHLIARETGEIQLTDYGVSGIPVFQISRFASYAVQQNKKITIHIDVMNHMSEEAFVSMMYSRREKYAQHTLEQYCTGLCHKKVVSLFAKLSGLSMEQSMNHISEHNFLEFIQLFKDWKLTLDRPNGFDMAQVCAGGLSMQEIDECFSLKKCPSIYVAGELLDVDGICGGYNLQWAWTSGYLAGKYASTKKE